VASSPNGPVRARLVLTVAEMLVLGCALGAGYLVQYRTQRRLFVNGLPTPDPYAFPRPGADVIAGTEALRSYWVAGSLVVVLFVWALVRSREMGWRRLAWLPLGIGGLGHLLAIPAMPSLSIDALSYLSHGWLAAEPGWNPYLNASADVAGVPYGQLLLAEGWLPVHGPSPYGPLWTHVERFASLFGAGQVGGGLLALKVVVVLAVLSGALVIWLIVRRVRPGWELTATLAYLWNPVVVVEFSMDGHNDALVIALALSGVWAAVTNRAFWAVIGLGLGASVKFPPLFFALPVLVLLIRRGGPRLSLLGRLAAGLGVVAVLTVLLYRPFWAGSATFDGLREGSVPLPSWSPAGWFSAVLHDPLTGLPDPRLPLLLTGVLVAAVLAVGWPRTDGDLLVACGVIAVVWLTIAPAYWPWYAAMPIAVLAARGGWVATLQLLALTLGSRLAAPFGDMFVLGMMPFERAMELSTLWGVDLPVLVCLLLAVSGVAVGRRRACTSVAAPRAVPDRLPPGDAQARSAAS